MVCPVTYAVGQRARVRSACSGVRLGRYTRTEVQVFRAMAHLVAPGGRTVEANGWTGIGLKSVGKVAVQ